MNIDYNKLHTTLTLQEQSSEESLRKCQWHSKRNNLDFILSMDLTEGSSS